MYTLNIYCPKCNEVMGTYQGRQQSNGKKSRLVCGDCKQKHIESMSIRNKSLAMREINKRRMVENNPMFQPEIRAKVASTISKTSKNIQDYIIPKKYQPKETLEECSTRMTLYNPVFDKDVAERSIRTRREKIKNGEIKYKRGSEHHLWQGNRDFNNSCRTWIYNKWTVKVLERDGFKCTKCNTNKNLQVHHIKPLREFINEIKIKYNIKSFTEIDSKNWQIYIDEICSNHKLEDGITLCNKCHAVIDSYYRI